MSIISRMVRGQLSGRSSRYRPDGLLCAVIVICAGAGSGVAWADDSAAREESAPLLEEVVVTARYRVESLEQTPIAITAFSANDLEARNMTKVTDLSLAVPSTTLVKFGSTGGAALVAYVRGEGQASHALAFQPGVPIYIDDIYQPTSYGSSLSLGDIESVEVLRGPQGTLFGKNSEGGAIIVRSVDPKGDDSGYAEAGAGSYSSRRFRGAFDTTVVPGNLFVRVSAGNESSDGYVTRLDYACLNPENIGKILPLTNSATCKLGTEGGSNDTYARVALKWLANDALTVRLSADTTQNNDEIVPEVPLIITNYPGSDLALFNTKVAVPVYGVPVTAAFIAKDPYTNYASLTNQPLGLTFSPENPQKTWDVVGKVDWNPGDGVHFTSISGYHNLRGTISEYKDGPIPINMIGNDINYASYTEEDRLTGKLFGERLEWTAGAYYFHGKGLQYGHIDLTASQVGKFFGVNEILSSPTADSDTSGYLHLVFHVTDALGFEAGARYSHDVFKYTYSGTNLMNVPADPLKVPGAGVFGPKPIPVESSTSRVDPKAALQYQWTEHFMTYAQYSTGFKGGGTNPNPISAAQATPFGVEELKSYEMGAKSELFDRRMTINTSVYYNDVTGLQLVGFGTTSAGGTITLNAGEAKIEGVELEIQARPVAALLMSLSADYLHFHYASLGAAAQDPVKNPGGLFMNDVAPYTPSRKVNAGIQYDLRLGAAGTVTPRVDATYQSRMYFDPQNLLASSQGGYALLNGHVTWQRASGKLSATIDVNNLTNKLYYLSMFNQLQSFGILTGQPGEPRNVMASLKYSF